MAKSCSFARNAMDGNIQGKLIFDEIVPTIFKINGTQTLNAITINNSNFTNGNTPSLTSTYIGYEIPFTMTNVSQTSILSVTAGGTNVSTPFIDCIPQISCNFELDDSIGTVAKGNFTQSANYIPLLFQPNNQSSAGKPYFVTLDGDDFVNGQKGGVPSGNTFEFKTSGLPMQTLSINNFNCLPIENNSDPYPFEKIQTFRSQPWFWDLMTVIFVMLFWTYFYLYILKPRGQGFHFEFHKSKSLTSSVD